MKLLLVVVQLVLLPVLGFASTIYDPDDFPTIQEAIDASSNGDVIIVRPGTYMEIIEFRGKAIALVSEDGPEVTTIDGCQMGSVVKFIEGEKRDTIIEGFTIENGVGSYRPAYNQYFGGGIRCHLSSPTIFGNVVKGNSVLGGNANGSGGGIYCWDSSALIFRNEILNNEAGTGGGIACDHGYPVIRENHVYGNTAMYGGGICQAYGAVDIGYNVVSDNNAFWTGGGIDTCSDVCGYIHDNVIVNNDAESGGGMCFEVESRPTVYNNIIWNNSAVGYSSGGGGIAVILESYPLIINNTIVHNYVSPGSVYNGGGGIVSHSGSTVTVVNCILHDNDAPRGNEILVEHNYPYGGSTLTISYSDVEGGQSSVHVDSGCTLNWGSGMIDADPLFVDAASGDLHLTWDSPCRDSGFNHASLPATDFENDPRTVGGIVDMGADEFYYHLYYSGDVLPGNTIALRVIGYPQAPVQLAWGQTIFDPPISTQHGNLHIWPFVWSGFIGHVQSNGVLSMPVAIPSNWQPGDHAPLQALVGPWGGGWTKLTNLMDVEVE